MELILIAIALAMDSVAVSIASGSKYRTISFPTVIKIALFFGIFQGLMPLIGYYAGGLFASFVDSIDHYIAFVILCYLGYRMKSEYEKKRVFCNFHAEEFLPTAYVF